MAKSKSAGAERLSVRVDPEEMEWLVWRAFERSDAVRLKELFAAGGNPNAKAPSQQQPFGHKGLSLLGLACALRSSEGVFEALLSAGADPNGEEDAEGGWRPLHVLMTCESDVDCDDPNPKDFTRGARLAKRVEMLAASGADLSAQGKYGSPLTLALECISAPARGQVVEALLRSGAGFAHKGGEELASCINTPNGACSHPQSDLPKMFALLRAAGAEPDPQGEGSEAELEKRAGQHSKASLAFVQSYLESRRIELEIGEATGPGSARQKSRRRRL